MRVWGAKYRHFPVVQVRLVHQSYLESFYGLLLETFHLQHECFLRTGYILSMLSHTPLRLVLMWRRSNTAVTAKDKARSVNISYSLGEDEVPRLRTRFGSFPLLCPENGTSDRIDRTLFGQSCSVFLRCCEQSSRTQFVPIIETCSVPVRARSLRFTSGYKLSKYNFSFLFLDPIFYVSRFHNIFNISEYLVH